jgi:hypothetical protein
MDDSLKEFVERQNISNYLERLKTETDAVQRGVLLRLLAEEETKQVKSFIKSKYVGLVQPSVAPCE